MIWVWLNVGFIFGVVNFCLVRIYEVEDSNFDKSSFEYELVCGVVVIFVCFDDSRGNEGFDEVRGFVNVIEECEE